jgi:predicted RNA-binding protein
MFEMLKFKEIIREEKIRNLVEESFLVHANPPL